MRLTAIMPLLRARSGLPKRNSWPAGGRPLGCHARLGLERLEDRLVLTTHTVGPAGDFLNIQDAINAANSGDAILLDGVTFTESNITVDRDLAIRGQGAGVTIVQAHQDPGSAEAGVFKIATGVTAIIASLTIQNGNSSIPGGGVMNFANLTLQSVGIINNTANAGGGVGSAPGSVLTIIASSITGSSAQILGGGIFVQGAELIITDSVIAGNAVISDSSAAGGGVAAFGSIVDISSSTIRDNTTSAPSTVGGGIFNFGGSATLNSTTISGNQAIGDSSFGGGILNQSNSMVSLTNVTISGNSTIGMGGGLDNRGSANLTNVTITDNQAGSAGGINNTGTLTLSNTIVAGNAATNVPDISSPAGTDSLGNNLIGDGTGATGITDGVNGDIVGTSADPVDPLLGALQNNGGPTETHALLPGSPATDAGNDNTAPPNDQRGVARPQGARTDIGAVEQQQAPNIEPSADDDMFVTDAANVLDVGPPGVLANDTDPDPQDTITVTNFDATSAKGAVVTVRSDGSYTYDPTGSAALQALLVGQTATDTFSYTISDNMGLTDTATVVGVVNGSAMPATITVFKFQDEDVNGQVDRAIDWPLEGWTIRLKDAQGAVVREDETDAAGKVVFDNLAPGTYVVEEELQQGFAQTFPGTPQNPATFTVTVMSGGSAVREFANRIPITSVMPQIRTSGNGQFVTEITVPFSRMLKPMHAGNPVNFEVWVSGKDRRFGTADDRIVPCILQYVAGDGWGETTMMLEKPLRDFRVRILAQTLEHPQGIPGLDGQGVGAASGDAILDVTRGKQIRGTDENGDRFLFRMRDGFVTLVQSQRKKLLNLHVSPTEGGDSRLTARLEQPPLSLFGRQRGAKGDKIVRIQSVTVDDEGTFLNGNRRGGGGLTSPRFQIGPLSQERVDELLARSLDTLRQDIFLRNVE